MNQPKHQVLIKFVVLCVVLVTYFGYLSYEYGLLTGGVASLITWSFFVLCTPVADAGFLLDFPLRVLFGIRMVFSELVVWGIAIGINAVAMLHYPQFYDTTFITRLMSVILINPYPYWSVIILSGIGTFLSIRFGDELMDVFHHKNRAFYLRHHFKHELVLIVFYLGVIFGYYKILEKLGISLAGV
ncbi:hypothetical protein ACFQ0F_10265 [Paraperlucidibaca wandonensis]|jgi:hypothetical protein|uniref:Uncharacterized protein n=1 Tax=Paraperlucidibaca wandonensis TaxID=1268273 RepID=A0ABW3HJ35_9GAMM|nr:hypothetical protein [Paraperlucidibaca sp.]MBQ0843108.1 hypothetical protein [Paraperlucidibaca sp.]|tara:strand:+ start:477 stop:1034 length:558 start_codon:yes stop_codon:yes gene_type:complete